MSHKKIANHSTVNNFNIMSAPIVGHTFIGLLEISDTNNWGQELGNRHFCGAHMMNKASKKPLSPETEKEQKYIDDDQTSVVFLAGLNSISHIKRFKSKAAAMTFINRPAVIDSNQDGSMLEIRGIPNIVSEES